MIKLKILFLSFVTAFSMLTMPALTIAASSADEVCVGVTTADGTPANCNSDASAKTLSKILILGIRMFQIIVGLISVFVLILAGLNYVTSGGDSGKTKTARERILYACVGIVIVVLSQVIVRFVLNRVSTVN